MPLSNHLYGIAMFATGALLASLLASRAPAVINSVAPPIAPNSAERPLTREDIAPLVCALVVLRDAASLPDGSVCIATTALEHAEKLGF